MRSVWASPPTAPMATGRRCWRARSDRPDRVDLVTVATPNSTHFEITKAFLEAGFNVLCEKPMTVTVEEGEEIVRDRQAHRRDLRRELLAIPAIRWCATCGRWWRAAISARCGWWWPNSPTATTPMPPMPTTRACAGAMTRRRRASRRSSPIAASMRCTWPASSAGDEVDTLVRRLRLDHRQPRAGR